MNDSVEHRRQRLGEAIAWCSLQKLQNNPPESDDVKRRRALGERAANDAFAAHQLEAASPFKWVTRSKVKKMKAEASLMLAQARLHEIRPLADQLRTAELKPPRQFDTNQDEQERFTIVDAVCERRADLLRQRGLGPSSESIDLGGGKILCCAFDDNVSDGAAGYDSKGFFDVECAPPWDTWVCYSAGLLISFVPRILCGLAQRGIEVDPVECVRWADTGFVTKLFGA